jgi:hypothetical protein
MAVWPAAAMVALLIVRVSSPPDSDGADEVILRRSTSQHRGRAGWTGPARVLSQGLGLGLGASGPGWLDPGQELGLLDDSESGVDSEEQSQVRLDDRAGSESGWASQTGG